MSSYEDATVLSLRMPPDLHRAATEFAKQKYSTSLTAYVNRAVEEAVKRDQNFAPPTPTGHISQYEAFVRFGLPDDGTSDTRAAQLVAQVKGVADLIGATDSFARVQRVIPLP
jgi:hypothetical protein